MKKVSISVLVAFVVLLVLLTLAVAIERRSGVECQTKARQIRPDTELCYRDNGSPILYGDDRLPIF